MLNPRGNYATPLPVRITNSWGPNPFRLPNIFVREARPLQCPKNSGPTAEPSMAQLQWLAPPAVAAAAAAGKEGICSPWMVAEAAGGEGGTSGH